MESCEGEQLLITLPVFVVFAWRESHWEDLDAIDTLSCH